VVKFLNLIDRHGSEADDFFKLLIKELVEVV